MILRKTWQQVRNIISEFLTDEALRLAAALSFYTLLSLAPLLIVFVGVAGMIFGQAAASGHLIGEIQRIIGPQAAEVAQIVLEHASTPKGNIVAIIAGIDILFFGAVGGFVELRSALNKIWGVKPSPGQGVRNFLRGRLASLLMLFGIGILLLISLTIGVILSAIGAYLRDLVPGFNGALYVLDVLASLALSAILFAMIFKILPDVEIHWRDVWLGALVTAVLFTIGSSLIQLYLGRSSVGSVYGAASSLVALVVWVYYSALIFFTGAEFTKIHARRRGARAAPGNHPLPAPGGEFVPGME